MVQNVNYWYNAQIRHLILCTIRLFSNFSISDGIDDRGNQILRRIPCTFMTSDKSAATELMSNTDTYVQSAPRMILTISSLKMNSEKMGGSPYYNYESEFTEKEFDEELGNYINKPGDTYHVTRLNPIPLGVTFKLYILSTMVSQKLQLLEQIRTLFTPTLELQTSENPLDWSRLTAITMTDINWSSKGTMNLDTTNFDMMDFTFEIDMNLDLPAIVEHSKIIETIIEDLNSYGKNVLYGWELDSISRDYYTPTDTSIILSNNDEITLIPNERCPNWYKLLKTYGINYNSTTTKLKLHCNINDYTNPKNISGFLTINPSNPLKANIVISDTELPKTNLPNVDSIIDPHDFQPQNIEGERYLLVNDLGSDTKIWGQIYNNSNELIDIFPKNSIIEFKNNHWTLMTDPDNEPAEYYVRDNEDIKYIYTYNEDYKVWVDCINKKYRPGYWRLSIEK